MDKLEQALSVSMLVMGLLLMLEGYSYLQRSKGDGLAIVLAGPDGIQKSAQAEFLRRRYGLRPIAAGELTRESAPGRSQRFLLRDCTAALCLATLNLQRDLPPPVFIEIADRRLPSPANPPMDVDLIQSYYPDADVWTLDGTRPPEAISETLQRLLDRPACR